MAYILRNEQGAIIAASTSTQVDKDWQFIENKHPEYIAFLEADIKQHDAFRESDIQLARVLEDLIEVLIERNLIQFTDFPSAAQNA